jgi:phosphoribosylglycinamide formyltransferase-1
MNQDKNFNDGTPGGGISADGRIREQRAGAGEPLRLLVLISGRGLNLKTVLDAIAEHRLQAEVLEVISNRPQARGLAYAREAGVPCRVIDTDGEGRPLPRADQDALIAERIRAWGPDLVLLSGYMRILGDELVDEFPGQLINQHPSLLPRHKGLHTHRRALAAGDRVHGASVHFVTRELDGGPIIARVRVPVRADDDEASLASRVEPAERHLLLAVLRLFAARRLGMAHGTVGTGGRDGVLLDGAPLNAPLEYVNGELAEVPTHA